MESISAILQYDSTSNAIDTKAVQIGTAIKCLMSSQDAFFLSRINDTLGLVLSKSGFEILIFMKTKFNFSIDLKIVIILSLSIRIYT